MKKVLGARSKQEVGGVSRVSCCGDAFGGELEIVDRSFRIVRGIFDGASGQTSVCSEADGFRTNVGGITKPVHQISGDGQGCGIHDLFGILQNSVTSYIGRRVEASLSEGETGACSSQRLETHGRQNLCAARIPGIGGYVCDGPCMGSLKAFELFVS